MGMDMDMDMDMDMNAPRHRQCASWKNQENSSRRAHEGSKALGTGAVPGMHGTPYFSTARPLARVWMSESLHHASPRPLGTWWRCTCTVYVCDDMLGMLKLMLGAIVLHHTRVTPLLGAAHRPREARGTFKVNNPWDPYDSTTSRIRPVDTVTIMWNDWREPISSGRHGASTSSKLLQHLLLNGREMYRSEVFGTLHTCPRVCQTLGSVMATTHSRGDVTSVVSA